MARRGPVSKIESKDRDSRPIRWRKYPHLFLIVCEDSKTEPYYFQTFENQIPEETIFLRAVGTGRSSKGVVERAIFEREKLSDEANKDVDETWAVFDKDDADQVPANALRFNDALKLAKEQKIRVAFSNEVFELWLLLHFLDISSERPIPRADIYLSLAAEIESFPSHKDFKYEHGKSEVIDAVIKLGDEQHAIRRAERLFNEQSGKTPIESNPNTTVHILVKRLRELIVWYSYEPD